MRYETAASVDRVTAPSGRTVACGVVVGLASGLVTAVGFVSFVAATTGSWLVPVGAFRLVGEQPASRGSMSATRMCRLICREQRRSGVAACDSRWLRKPSPLRVVPLRHVGLIRLGRAALLGVFRVEIASSARARG